MHRFVPLLLLLVSLTATAQFRPFIEGGVTRFGTQANGVWYQKGLPYSLDVVSPTIKIGFSNSDWSFGYTYIGTVSSDCLCTPTDSNYDNRNHRLHDPREPLTRFKGSGDVQGVFAERVVLRYNLVGQETKWGSAHAFVRVGALAYWPRWTVKVGDEKNPWHPWEDWNARVIDTVHHRSRVRLSPSLALGAAVPPWSLQMTGYLWLKGEEPFTPLYDGAATLTVRYTFN